MTKAHQAGGKPNSYGLNWFVNIGTARPTPMMPVGSFRHRGAFPHESLGVGPTGTTLVTVFIVQDVLVPNAQPAPRHLPSLRQRSAGRPLA